MRFTLEDMKNIVLGAEKVIPVQDGVEFLRFQEKEQGVYAPTSILGQRMQTPAGVQLLFKTNGDSIYIRLEAEGRLDRSFFCLDVIEDGVLIGSVKNFDEEKMTGFYSWDKYPTGIFEGTFGLKAGEKEIRIVLPWSVRTIIQDIRVDNAEYIVPVKPQPCLLAYGDSITHGYDSIHPSGAYVMKLARRLGCEIFVKAIGGACFRPAMAEAATCRNPAYITVAYGTNDWGSGEKDVFDKDSEAFIRILREKYPQSKIFVITPIWRKDHGGVKGGFEDISCVSKTLHQICEGMENVFCIEGWDLIPHEETLYGDLRLHPNDNGFDHYFENLYKAMERYL